MIFLRMLLRDWRSGELAVLSIALAIAVAAMTTVGFFSERVRIEMERQASRILGADLMVDSDHPLAERLGEEAAAAGLKTAQVLKFPSMAGFGAASVLSEIKAVSQGYPLRGELRISSTLTGEAKPAPGLPPPGSVWADRKLLARLGMKVGDRLEVGNAAMRVDAAMEEEPDEGIGLFALGPKVLMNLDDLEKTGLIGPGSRVHYLLLVAGDEGRIADFRARAQLARGEKIEGVRDSRPEIRQMLDRGEEFLDSAALVSVVLAAAAIYLAARRFSERHLDGCALLRVLGFSQKRIFGLYFNYFLAFGLVVSLSGAAAGFLAQKLLAVQLAPLIDATLPAPSWKPFFAGTAGGMILLMGFVLPPIAALARVPAVKVLRREGGGGTRGYFAAFVSLLLIFVWQSGKLKTGLWLFAGFSAGLILFAALAYAALSLLQGGASGWRLGVANLKRRSATSVMQIVAFGLGLMALIFLTLIRADLLQSWQQSLPPDAPNRFLLDIREDQLAGLGRFFAAHGASVPQMFPMVKGRLVEISGREIFSANYQDPRAKRLVDREFNLSWSGRLPEGNSIVEGKWREQGRMLSVEEGIAKTLGIKLHDRLVFDVYGQRVGAEVANIRRVPWDSFRVNFFVLGTPGIFDAYPKSYITSFYLPAGRYSEMNELVHSFPNLLVLDVSSLIGKVQRMMDQATKAVEFVFVFSLFSGVAVLYAAFSASQDERCYETAILRALGARRRQVLAIHAAEFLFLGGLAGLFAAVGANVLGFLVSRKLLDLPFLFDPLAGAAGVFSGAALVLIFGLPATLKLARTPPASVLRE